MQSSNAPSKIQLPFAASGTKNTIPVPSQQGITPGAASFTDGFPPLTFTPLSAGGVPPAGADFNGVLNAITAVQQWQNAGGFFPFDASFASAIGGYPRGAMLLNATFSGLWVCTSDNNTTNPDTGGAGWIAFMPHGKQIFTSSGTFTPPYGITSGWISGCGGGAGGGAGGSNNRMYVSPAAGSGGAGGGAGQSVIRQPVTWGTSPVAVTIGAAGTGGASTSDAGTPPVGPSNGGTTSFGSFIVLAGGVAGANGGNGAIPGGGVHGSGAIGAQDGSDAQAGTVGTGNGGNGGGSPFGTGGGGSRAGVSSVAWSPSAAYGFGAGGGGGGGQEDGTTPYAGSAGGNGTPGIIIVES